MHLRILYIQFPDRAAETARDRTVHEPHVVTYPNSARSTSRDIWNCPVCFHAQNGSNASCEICAAKNTKSAGSDYEVVLQCHICAFRNKKSASVCSLCQTSLKMSHGSESIYREQTTKLKGVPQLNLNELDDGWLT